MISWISGDIVDLWQTNQKFFVLVNCQGLGYEIQILESFFLKLKTNQISTKNITLWIKHIKKEDSDLLFGFTSKDQKNFFIEILSIRGVGSQIGIGLFTQLGQTFLTIGLKNLSASEASTINYLQVLFGSIWGILFFSEIININFLLGASLVLLGTIMSTSKIIKRT